MHDLDRAMFETGEYESHDAQHSEHSERQEFLELLGELTGRSDGLGRESPPAADRFDRTIGETELATELLEAQGSGELDRFLGRLLGQAAGAARDFARSDTGRALGGILKKAAGEALPVIGRGIGTAVGPEHAGPGERVGRSVGTLFGLELEGLSQEDREFEVAKAFVRFANAAARQAAQAPIGAPPVAVASAAATTAARRHAPGLLATLSPNGTAAGRQHSGRWERHGDQIVIFGG